MRLIALCLWAVPLLIQSSLIAADYAPATRTIFRADSVKLESGEILAPVTIGYETSGTLNEAKDNVLFVCPEFRSLGHVAGPLPGIVPEGQLDGLVGPGLLFDTNKLFVVASDGLGCPLFMPDFVNTGPAAINPQTGKPYGMDFPTYTVGDMALLHRMLLESLGIKKVKILLGQSMGAWQVMEWVVAAPETVENAILIAADGRIQPLTANAPFGLGLAQIMADPAWNKGDYYGKQAQPSEGVLQAQWVLISWTTSYQHMDQMYERRKEDFVTRVKNGLDPLDYRLTAQQITLQPDGRIRLDPNAWIYRARASILSDPGRGRGGYAAALDRVKARVLIIMSKSDLLNPPRFGRETVELLKSKGKQAEFVEIDGQGGHAGACKDESDRLLFSPAIRKFLE